MANTLNAADFLLAGKQKNRVALTGSDGDYTYGHLQSGASEFAARLFDAGCNKGDRVLLIGSNSFHWAAAYLGTLKAELVCVPLPAKLSAEELKYYIDTTEPRAAFVNLSLLAKCGEALAGTAITVFCEDPPGRHGWFQFAQTPAGGPPSPVAAETKLYPDLAALMFTSGSTGRPRGVMVSHSNIVANTKSIIASLHLSEHERMMTVLPFHYCFGASLLHTYLRVGGRLVLDNRFTYPEVVLENMAQQRCTSFAGVPSHYQILLRNSSLTRKRLPHLRTLLQAGGHLAPPFVHQLHETLPQARIFIMYGQTEATARLACMPPEMLATRPGSIGKAITGVRLSILKASGEEAATGEIGEIVAEGENVTHGYWRAPEESSATFRNGKLYTGDLATMDKDGFLYVVDRAREFVKCGGTRISCRQIEDRLLECEELLEAAVIAVPDDVLGEAARAFVVPRQEPFDGVAQRVRAFCKSSLHHTLIPRDVFVVESLPKNSHGKVLRPQLKSMATNAQGDCCLAIEATAQ